MLTGIKAGATGNAFIPVHLNSLLPVLHFYSPVRHNDWAD